MSKISKWTLSIKDRSVSSQWQAYCEKNVMKLTPPCIVFHIGFVAVNLTGLLNDRLLSIPRASISVISFCLICSLYFLSRTTGKFVFMRCFPVLLQILHFVFSNALIYYALSEAGAEAGREQFGDQDPVKLRQLTYTFRDNLTTAFTVSITLLSPSWFWYSIISSTGYFCAQNLLHY